MYVSRIIFQQAASAASSNQAAAGRTGAGRQAPPSGDELRDQIKQTILAAQEAARDARSQARDAQSQARDAQNQARDGQRNAQEKALEAQIQARIAAGMPVIAQSGSHTIQLDDFPNNVIPPQVVDISIAFFVMCAVMVIGWPLARAFGRRLERTGAAAAAAVPAGMGDQLQRIEQAVEAMSIEIERISESQRFLAKLQSSSHAEQGALPGSERR